VEPSGDSWRFYPRPCIPWFINPRCGRRIAAHVNLDALIVREDFEVVGEGGEAPTKPSIEIRELEHDQFFFGGLRKPDFQRETSEWDPKRVAGLVRTFLKDDLIPG
jgi:hypothetical protein